MMRFPNIAAPGEIALWEKAGNITMLVREYARSIIEQGMSILTFTELVEKKVKALDAQLAFPVNISFNEVAAHDAAHPQDSRVFGKDIVKIDIGVSVDGYIGDTAFTVDFSGEYGDLIQATEEALQKAIATVKAGVTLGEIGLVIQRVIESYGFVPVVNLSGHGIAQYEIHTSPSVPNYGNNSSLPLEEGMIIAIEPFATNGKGKIAEVGKPVIFSQIAHGNVRSMYGRKLLQQIVPLKGLPFSLRDLHGLTETQILFGLKELLQQGIIRDYPPLVEIGKGMVSQAEHTLLVTASGAKVLTW